ncbi:EEIG family member 2-like [Amphiura filiformis]|uniref:EEIG family member 2-like n=1 Tax=Amphiura filiformis TaxID=82378 RepID=UPI003B221B16
MSLMMKKKKFKFNVNFELVELSSIPFVNGVLFGKVRLLDGGKFEQQAPRQEVSDHAVHWKSKFQFNCRMSANVSTGILEPCLCRVSIRKEIKGGKSYTKYGFVDINLAEYAGSGNTRSYLLEGYDTRNRQDNSIVKVKIEMTLSSGDPCFKAPDVVQHFLPGEQQEEMLKLSLRGDDIMKEGGSGSLVGSSGRSRGKPRSNLMTSSLVSPAETLPEGKAVTSQPSSDEVFELGHSRSSSYNSQQSKASGYSSAHSRSSSQTEHFSSATSLTEQQQENEQAKDAWRGVGTAERERRRKQAEESEQQKRVENTRIDADEIIEGIIRQQDFQNQDESAQDEGLQLYIAKDGSTALGSHQLKNRMSAGVFEQVVIDQR